MLQDCCEALPSHMCCASRLCCEALPTVGSECRSGGMALLVGRSAFSSNPRTPMPTPTHPAHTSRLPPHSLMPARYHHTPILHAPLPCDDAHTRPSLASDGAHTRPSLASDGAHTRPSTAFHLPAPHMNSDATLPRCTQCAVVVVHVPVPRLTRCARGVLQSMGEPPGRVAIQPEHHPCRPSTCGATDGPA